MNESRKMSQDTPQTYLYAVIQKSCNILVTRMSLERSTLSRGKYQLWYHGSRCANTLNVASLNVGLKSTQMNLQYRLIWELSRFEFEHSQSDKIQNKKTKFITMQ